MTGPAVNNIEIIETVFYQHSSSCFRASSPKNSIKPKAIAKYFITILYDTKLLSSAQNYLRNRNYIFYIKIKNNVIVYSKRSRRKIGKTVADV